MSNFTSTRRKSKLNTIEHRQERAGERLVTPAQLRLLHVARRHLMLDEAAWRDLLRGECGVVSAKALTQNAVRKLLSALGGLGFCPHTTKSLPQSIEARRASCVDALEKEALRTLGQNWQARLEGACRHFFSTADYGSLSFEEIRRLRAFVVHANKKEKTTHI